MNFEQKEICAILGFEGQLRLKICNEQGGATKWLNISEAQAREILRILGDNVKAVQHGPQIQQKAVYALWVLTLKPKRAAFL